MGAALSYMQTPITDLETSSGSTPATDELVGVSYGTCSLQGWRRAQEDAHISEAEFDGDLSLFAVFDGHGGAEVALWCAANFGRVLKEEEAYEERDYPRALRDAFLKVDVTLRKPEQLAELARLQVEHGDEQTRLNEAHEDNKEDDDEGGPASGNMIKRMLMEHLAANGGGSISAAAAAAAAAYGGEDGDGDDDDDDEEDDDEQDGNHEEGEEEQAAAGSADNANLSNDDDAAAESTKARLMRRLACEEADIGDDEEDDDDEEEEGGDDDDEEEEDAPGFSSGCTAVVVLIDRRQRKLWCANAGDSRAILARDGAIALSEDHKPEDEGETRRIVAAGGRVVGGRVDGNLNLSRALGDLRYKSQAELGPHEQRISALPDVVEASLGDATGLVMICDGITGVLEDAEVVEHVQAGSRSEVEQASDLCKSCVAEDCSGDGTGCDNETVLVLRFDYPKSKAAASPAPPHKVPLDYPPAANLKKNKLDDAASPSTKRRRKQ